jgi:GMP synthase-like glutamine amidotransferase
LGGNRGSTVRVVIIRHHTEDSAGFIAEAFEARGAELSTHLFPDDGPLPAFDDVDHIVMLGAIPSIYDPSVPWVQPELEWLRAVDEAGVPVLGICYGAQELCTIFGGKVVAADQKEVGWLTIDSARPDLIPAGPWLLFHGDRCEPSPQVTVLASNATGVQAFAVGRHLGVQFHPEVDGEQLKLWLEFGGRQEALAAGQDPDALLAQAYDEEPDARVRADRLVETALQLANTPILTR